MLTSAAALMVCLATSQVIAQDNQGGGGGGRGRGGFGGGFGGGRRGQGNFDPAQFQQRMLENYRERLEVTDDAEWNVMKPLVQKVVEAREAAMAGGRGGFMGGGRGGRGNRGGDNAQGDNQNPRRNPNPAMSNPAADDLRKAIESKAPSSEIKPLLARYFEDRKAKRAELEKAQEALRAVLTPRQEAIAALAGLL